MKKTFKVLCLAVLTAFLLTSCEKEETQPNSTGIALSIDANQEFDVKKGFVLQKIDTVYIWDTSSGDVVKHRTIKFRDLQSQVVQEWLLDDLHVNLGQAYATWSGDESGEEHGFYYKWSEIAEMIDTDAFSYIIYRTYAEAQTWTNPIQGFQVPQIERSIGDGSDQILQLASKLGSTSYLRYRLKMDYDGWENGAFTNAHEAAFWYEARGSYNASGIYPGCGVLAAWESNNNDHFVKHFSNAPGLRANVRLVRTLPLSEW